ncbi:hypothetical protein LA080_013061 [Diaporthe eres]|nr:hypothetical protein LA080_013061 [Diaporthe eres]
MASSSKIVQSTLDYSFLRNLKKPYLKIKAGKGNYLETTDGRKVFDAATGAAVACLGYGNEKVIKAVNDQMNTGIAYLAAAFWRNDVVEELCQELISGTDGKMAGVYLTGSGSEAMEASLKLSRQYFYEQDKQTPRVNFIARERSYHGNTLGALSVSEFRTRKEPYTPYLMRGYVHHIPSCYTYRQQLDGESDHDFISRKAKELEDEFQRLGPETVAAFIAEPVVGAALGCAPYAPGYLKAMKKVCHKYGALFILDEVMCGMGRTGTLHAWQAEDVVPDIQTNAKGLGGGYQPIASVMLSEKILNVVKQGTGEFIHGLTYEAMPVQAAAALEVQRIIREENLLDNVSKQGAYLQQRLREVLGNHPNVGDIRGKGLFWGLEFVEDKATKQPFDPKLGIAQKVLDLAISPRFNMTVYPSTGCVDGIKGDLIILAPSYTITEKDVDHIVTTVSEVIRSVFSKLSP